MNKSSSGETASNSANRTSPTTEVATSARKSRTAMLAGASVHTAGIPRVPSQTYQAAVRTFRR